MLGEDEDNQEEGSFNSKSIWARMAIVFAGPFFNFILALLLAFIVIGAKGADVSYVTNVDKASPAYEAGTILWQFLIALLMVRKSLI